MRKSLKKLKRNTKRNKRRVRRTRRRIKGGKLIPFSELTQVPDLISYGVTETIDTFKIPPHSGGNNPNPLPFIQQEKYRQINNIY